MKTIEEFWQDYRNMVYPALMPPGQEREVRMAFVAGVGIALEAMSKISELPEAVAVAQLDKLHQEWRTLATAMVEDGYRRAAKRQ
jgi:hypothetical protein